MCDSLTMSIRMKYTALIALLFPIMTAHSKIAIQPLPQLEDPVTFPAARIYEMIIRISEEYDVNPALAMAVAEIESNFDQTAYRYEPRLNTASVGIFQVLYTTAQTEFGFKGTVRDLQDPRLNIRLGVRYIKRCAAESAFELACCYQAGFYASERYCAQNQSILDYATKLEEKSTVWDARLAGQ